PQVNSIRHKAPSSVIPTIKGLREEAWKPHRTRRGGCCSNATCAILELARTHGASIKIILAKISFGVLFNHRYSRKKQHYIYLKAIAFANNNSRKWIAARAHQLS